MFLKKIVDNRRMDGMTIDEIASSLGIPWKTAHKRIEKLGIKPLSYKALYAPSVVEQIRNVRSKGRPPKKPVDAP
jgi:enoyl reductase-like protein